MRAEIIAVGSELLTHGRADTNSLWMTGRLNGLGIFVRRKMVVCDDQGEIAQVVRDALSRAEVVITCGGLGPTHDDLTREGISDALGLPLHFDESILKKIEERYRKTHRAMPENNRQQAMVPQGAEVFDNPNGSAPGLFLKVKDSLLFILPGPPRELEPMFETNVIPTIRREKPVCDACVRHLIFASVPESEADERLGDLYRDRTEFESTILSTPGIVELMFVWNNPADREGADAELDRIVGEIRRRMGPSVVSARGEPLEAVTTELLRRKGKTLATAESCTGGWLGKMLTDLPGSSDVYLGGVVSYSNEVKIDALGVDRGVLEAEGAVSEPVVCQMAEGVRERTGADFGIGITGVAGPTGGTPDKPVGLVYVGLSGPDETVVKRLQLPGDREMIRLRSCRFALDLLRRRLIE